MRGAAVPSFALALIGSMGLRKTDAMIAATATVRELTVATRNTRDFASLGVASTNPFEATGGR